MKRLFFKIAEFLGLVKSKKIDLKQVGANTVEKKPPNTTPYESMSNGVVEESGVKPRDIWAKEPMQNKEILNTRKIIKPIKKSYPKNANKVQNLSSKFNNPKSVYRDNKGRFSSFKK
jgi:hypothetical protein